MKKLLAIALILMFALIACASAEGTTFKMGIDAEYPPYTYLGDDGEYTGFDVEMCQKVCEILGWELEDYSENHWSLYGDLPVIALIMAVSGAIIALSGKKLRGDRAVAPASNNSMFSGGGTGPSPNRQSTGAPPG